MSWAFPERHVAKSRKARRCALCGESILVGEPKVVRPGVSYGDFYAMHMHPECRTYESKLGEVDPDWYEDASDPAFSREDAVAYADQVQQDEEDSHCPSRNQGEDD